MKTMKTTILGLTLMLCSMNMQAQPMSYYAMRENARFLTDRMAYTLGLTASLLEDLYMINFDYICGVNDYLDDVAYGYHYDDYMAVIYARDAALRRLLTLSQWNRLVAINYFYRPITFTGHRWAFGIYAYDTMPRTHFYFAPPRHFDNGYRGGQFFRGMAPAGGPVFRNNRTQHGNYNGPDRGRGGYNDGGRGGYNDGGRGENPGGGRGGNNNGGGRGDGAGGGFNGNGGGNVPNTPNTPNGPSTSSDNRTGRGSIGNSGRSTTSGSRGNSTPSVGSSNAGRSTAGGGGSTSRSGASRNTSGSGRGSAGGGGAATRGRR